MIHPSIAGRDSAALGLAAVCWGLGTVISKAALAEIPPLSLLTIQLGSSVAVLALIMRRQGIRLRDDRQALLGRLGLLNPGVAYALSLLGLLSITASLSVVLWALEPLVILVLAGAFLGERITPGLVALSLAAVAGMVFAVYEPAIGGGELVGVALTLAGVGCCAVYTVVTRRFIPNAAETGQVVLSQQAHALLLAFVLILLVTLLGGQVVPARLTPLGLASAVGSGVLYYAGAYWFYLGALRRVPASIAASSFYLIPIVGLAGGAVLLGERLAASQWLGAAIVLGSVLAIVVRYADRGAVEVRLRASPG
jgi:drug/metabolite transporter (DMT)-like permease